MRNWRGFSVVLLIVLFVIFFSFVFFVNANNQISVEAGILSSDQYTMINAEDSYLYFGNISKGEASSSQSTCINNTGTNDVSLSFSVVGGGSFSNYLFIKNYSGGNYSSLGSYALSLGTSSSDRRKCVRFILNLTDYSSPIYSSFTSYRANVTISAVPI
jgi:hypothetical protein